MIQSVMVTLISDDKQKGHPVIRKSECRLKAFIYAHRYSFFARLREKRQEIFSMRAGSLVLKANRAEIVVFFFTHLFIHYLFF